MNIDQVRQFTQHLMNIAQKYGISKIYVFGSVARGDNTSLSDVDFLVDLQEDASLFSIAGFSYEAEKLLASRWMWYLYRHYPWSRTVNLS